MSGGTYQLRARKGQILLEIWLSGAIRSLEKVDNSGSEVVVPVNQVDVS